MSVLIATVYSGLNKALGLALRNSKGAKWVSQEIGFCFVCVKIKAWKFVFPLFFILSSKASAIHNTFISFL